MCQQCAAHSAFDAPSLCFGRCSLRLCCSVALWELASQVVRSLAEASFGMVHCDLLLVAGIAVRIRRLRVGLFGTASAYVRHAARRACVFIFVHLHVLCRSRMAGGLAAIVLCASTVCVSSSLLFAFVLCAWLIGLHTPCACVSFRDLFLHLRGQHA